MFKNNYHSHCWMIKSLIIQWLLLNWQSTCFLYQIYAVRIQSLAKFQNEHMFGKNTKIKNERPGIAHFWSSWIFQVGSFNCLDGERINYFVVEFCCFPFMARQCFLGEYAFWCRIKSTLKSLPLFPSNLMYTSKLSLGNLLQIPQFKFDINYIRESSLTL